MQCAAVCCSVLQCVAVPTFKKFASGGWQRCGRQNFSKVSSTGILYGKFIRKLIFEKLAPGGWERRSRSSLSR